MMDGWGLPAHGRKGRWTALIEPMFSRSTRFHLLRRSHVSEGTAVVRANDDGSSRMESVKEYAVSLTFTELDEGATFPRDPTIRGTSEGFSGDNEVRDFLQAVVDCAAGMGIVPSQHKDRTDEIAVTRDHLEDMRRLVFREKHQPMQPRTR